MSLAFVTESLEVWEFAIRMASEAESHMTSVERVLNYTKIESEPGYSTDTVPDESWPTVGSLTLHDLSLAYVKDAPPVLKSININVAAKEKVGVVGRTGAGKSSLVAALFRMPEPEGQVSNHGLFVFGATTCTLLSQMFVLDNKNSNNNGHGLCSRHEGHHGVANIADIRFYQYIIFHHSQNFLPLIQTKKKK